MVKLKGFKKGLFQSSQWEKLSDNARLLFLILATCPYAYDHVSIDLEDNTALHRTIGWKKAKIELYAGELRKASLITQRKSGYGGEVLNEDLFDERAAGMYDANIDRKAIYKRDNWQCVYCGKSLEHPDIDHLIPVSRGGLSNKDNLVTCCRRCNASKGNQTLSEWYKSSLSGIGYAGRISDKIRLAVERFKDRIATPVNDSNSQRKP